MKKIISLLLVAVMASAMLVGCGNNAAEETTNTANVAEETTEETEATEEVAEEATEEVAAEGFELALVTDIGTIDDKSFNQGAWEGLERYAEENGVTYKYYQPQEKTTDAYVNTIGLAIEGGAKIVVCPGFLFETPVYNVQNEYPDVQFILLDGVPNDGDWSNGMPVFETASNVMSIQFKEDQSGYLAGYAAVMDGNTKLGFMGGMAVPAVVRFGYGFVQGANDAAAELGTDVEVMYYYTGGFEATPEAQSTAASWYENGTEVIFACGGAVGNSVMAAAEAADAKVIGVDVDQSGESETVITSAMKLLSNSVYDGIAASYAGSFPGGATTIFSAENNGVGLPMESSKFETFSTEDYDTLLAKLAANEIAIVDSVDDTTTADLELSNATVTYVE